MHCPKCNHEQKNAVECESCGVIFERFREFQEKKKAKESVVAEPIEKNGLFSKALQLIVLVVAVAGTTYYFTGYKKAGPEPIANVDGVIEDIVVQTQPRPKASPKTVPISEKPGKFQYNTIETARNATVSIETPWGTGSGFFISKDFIVTNKHVVEFDEREVAKFKDQVLKLRRLIDLEKDKIANFRRELRKLPKGPTRSQLIIIIDDRVAKLEQVIPQQQQMEEKLERMEDTVQPSSIKIFLADGSEHVANYLLLSADHDLALMSLYAGKSDFLRKSPEKNSLHQGDKVYAIGSPVGLRNTVTSGIFSSYRREGEDGPIYLQTDAAINPGNSGGPLIDEKGYVWGVNTSILRNTEGIGFAIPMTTVYEEFSSSIY
ncbi:MAG: serine protease Do [Desulforhopalus sp.]|jgi:serine protease Do